MTKPRDHNDEWYRAEKKRKADEADDLTVQLRLSAEHMKFYKQVARRSGVPLDTVFKVVVGAQIVRSLAALKRRKKP